MNLTFLFFIIISLVVYTLYYTFNNNFSIFLLTVLVFLIGLYIYEFVKEKINIVAKKFVNKNISGGSSSYFFYIQ
jgi:sugar phosphate permease